MKALLIFWLMLNAVTGYAQHNGYYITLAGDTIPAFIHLKKDVFGPYSFYGVHKEVRISSDSLSEEKIFRPEEITAFYVKNKMGAFRFYSIQHEDEKRFMQAAAITASASLFYYRTVRPNGESIRYTIKKDDAYLFIFNRNHVKLKQQLRTFFRKDEKALKEVELLFRQPGYVDRDLVTLFERLTELL